MLNKGFYVSPNVIRGALAATVLFFVAFVAWTFPALRREIKIESM